MTTPWPLRDTPPAPLVGPAREGARPAAAARVPSAGLLAMLGHALVEAAGHAALASVQRGKLRQAAGTVIRATGVRADVGELCRLVDNGSRHEIKAEVIGFDGETVLMSPMGSLAGLSNATQVIATGQPHSVAVGGFLLGRVVDGMGEAFLDDGPPIPALARRRIVASAAPAPMRRRSIDTALPLGITAIDALLTCGVGQRTGIFSPAGCGKSTLLSMLCRHAEVDVVVAALVGERGREVQDFIAEALGPGARERAVLVVATSDRPATERVKAAFVATAYAEEFAAAGKRVLLVVDSVTRLARAAREIGLAAGEPPTRRGFPPSVFAMLPQLFERAGRLASGSITAFYTVLEESDDGSDPISEEVRSLLDGHIVLSRKLAGKGHYPAIDTLQSASRLFDRVVEPPQLQDARRVRELLSKFDEVEILIRIGEFRRGVDELADQAVDRRPAIDRFLRQERRDHVAYAQTLAALREVVA
jgi:ATP synthase in type III secretion protein N